MIYRTTAQQAADAMKRKDYDAAKRLYESAAIAAEGHRRYHFEDMARQADIADMQAEADSDPWPMDRRIIHS